MIEFYLFSTTDSGQLIDSPTARPRWVSPFGDVRLSDRAGDEFSIKAGELNLTFDFELKFSTSVAWLAVYVEKAIYNIYKIENQYLSYDEKSNVYKYKLRPLQAIFFEELNYVIAYTATAGQWSYDFLVTAGVVIEEIKINDNPPHSILDRWGFSLTDMIEGLAGRNRLTGYRIGQVSTPLPSYGENNLPVVYRGLSKEDSAAEQTVVEFNFEDDGVTWKDIFKFALFATNSLLSVRPKISGGGINRYLEIDLELVPRTGYQTSFEKKSVKWYDRTLQRNKRQVEGVKLEGENFEYKQGDVSGNLVFENKVAVNDPSVIISQYSTSLYWSVGDYDSGVDKYDITQGTFPDNTSRPYFQSGLVEPYYAGMITDGDVYTGKIDFPGNIVMSFVPAGDETILVISQSTDKNRISQIEGLVI